MKIQLIKGCVVHGKPRKEGDIINVQGPEAVTLISMGRAVRYSEEAPEAPQKRTRSAKK